LRPALVIEATEMGIRAVRFGRGRGDRTILSGKKTLAREWARLAMRELRAYFGGKLRTFSTPCDLTGLTFFTRAVLRITAQIPFGEVRSYRWVAERLGKPEATRAVGVALARNPIPFIIPCHRVVRSDGALGGYALGLRWKERLLALEGKRQKPKNSLG